jgi:type IV pilus assembly protein PilM
MSIFHQNLHPFGIDFSDRVIKIAQLEKKNERLILSSYIREDIPEGIIEDGEIKSKFVIYSIPETKGFIRVIKIPYTEKEGLENVIFTEVEQLFPISPDESYVDWQVLGSADNNRTLEVLVAAVPQNVVDSYSESLTLAGLKPVAAEIESIAISRSLINENASQKPVLIIDMGKDRTGFIIFKSPAVQFTASIPVCGKETNRAIARKMGISEAEAEALKNKCGLDPKEDCSEIYKAMDSSLNEMTGYINKLLEYYHEHHKNEADISKVVICGGESKIAGVSPFLSLKIKKEIEKGNPWINIISTKYKEIPIISRSDSLVFVTVLGLALRGIEEDISL